MISLDCKSSSLLDFEKARGEALTSIARGKPIDWFFDFGFSNEEETPLFDSLHGGAHRIAIDHFMKTIWPEFSSYCRHLIFYEGSISMAYDFSQFGDYCNFLADAFQEELPFTILFKNETLSPLEIALKTTPEIWGRFNLFINGKTLDFRTSLLPTALLIPPIDRLNDPIISRLKEAAATLKESPRFVYEPFLTSEWEGLETLIVLKETLRPDTERKLAGFRAAEGTIIMFRG